MKFLAVNFHYIDEEDKYKSGIYPVSPERLSAQLDELSKTFSFIGQNELVDAIDGRQKMPEFSCVITFDDGLRCQFENALPIIEKKGIPAMFFVNSSPYTDHKACTVHEIHRLLADLSPAVFILEVKKQISETRSDVDKFIEGLKPKAALKYRYDDPETAVIKFILNSVLSVSEREKIVRGIFERHIPDEKAFCESLYMSKDQIKTLYSKGYLGLHGHNHIPLSTTLEEIEPNVRLNKETIEGIVGGPVFGISYPYGSKMDVNEKASVIYEKMGLKFGFTMERAFNSSLSNPFLFARADTNDVPGGKSPCFEMKNGEIILKQNFSISRRLFFDESGMEI